MLSRRPGVRTRILAIALVPGLALVAVGVGATGYLVDRSNSAQDWADEMRAGVAPTRELIDALAQERRITLWRMAGADTDLHALAAARQRLDAALRELVPAQSRLTSMGPEAMGDATSALTELSKRLTVIRVGLDAGTLPIGDADAFYSSMPQFVLAGVRIAQQTAPDPATAIELADASGVLEAQEAMGRANALGAALLVGGIGLPADLADEYLLLVGFYHDRVQRLLADADPAQAEAAKTLVASAAWQRLSAMETALTQRAVPRPDGATFKPAPLPLSPAAWADALAEVNKALADIWQDENSEAQRLAADAAADTSRNSLLAGAAMVVVALGAILVALALANRIIRRLRRLRDETIALADERLPETMRLLSAGDHVDIDTGTPALAFGRDEIGQVADAFSHAHTAAVSAAVTESRTREGVKAVFLNIAHRSQVVVHRQLEILDEAESEQEDPALLETFFLLDHLATRERRNAENLVILAGGRPGRQWRNPVPLMELVRSAVGETVDYQRIRTGRLPQTFIVGLAVGDLIHLLAELIDNAAHFSPPQSKVQITGNAVGRGVALEIIDQGVGVPEAELERINTLLATAADFGLSTFSSDSRLGLFVVSQLAARHGISVRLSESDYGGLRAIVLVPATLIAGETPSPDFTSGQLPIPRRAEFRSDTGELPVLDAPARREALPPARSLPAAHSAWDRRPAPGESVQDTNGFRARPDRTMDTGRHARMEPPTSPLPSDRSAHAIGHPAAARGTGSDRPALPKRRRQESLAPELAHDPAPGASTAWNTAVPEQAPPALPERSPEQARNLMSAIENGTRQGRGSDPRPLPSITTRQEGDGEYFSRR
ncbi:sensor histidine kinase [Nocardia acidivorans]|uniref:sensor histidine kinase n=1 Tax=Nocardia acidivorans TaxID=404580 RepID=UPI00082C4CF1|nr:nitrate- and nitrite sensing domain-containing protein [Nocardia acidivorans]